MSLLSSPYLPERISLSSKTGVSMVCAPCFLKTLVIFWKMASRRTWSLPSQSRVPLGTLSVKSLDCFAFDISAVLLLLLLLLLLLVALAVTCGKNEERAVLKR